MLRSLVLIFGIYSCGNCADAATALASLAQGDDIGTPDLEREYSSSASSERSLVTPTNDNVGFGAASLLDIAAERQQGKKRTIDELELDSSPDSSPKRIRFDELTRAS